MAGAEGEESALQMGFKTRATRPRKRNVVVFGHDWVTNGQCVATGNKNINPIYSYG